MGKAEYFESFKQNADGFICSILPGVSHPQVQYSRGKQSIIFIFIFFSLSRHTFPISRDLLLSFHSKNK